MMMPVMFILGALFMVAAQAFFYRDERQGTIKALHSALDDLEVGNFNGAFTTINETLINLESES